MGDGLQNGFFQELPVTNKALMPCDIVLALAFDAAYKY